MSIHRIQIEVLTKDAGRRQAQKVWVNKTVLA